jgi:hypothetical protein
LASPNVSPDVSGAAPASLTRVNDTAIAANALAAMTMSFQT